IMAAMPTNTHRTEERCNRAPRFSCVRPQPEESPVGNQQNQGGQQGQQKPGQQQQGQLGQQKPGQQQQQQKGGQGQQGQGDQQQQNRQQQGGGHGGQEGQR